MSLYDQYLKEEKNQTENVSSDVKKEENKTEETKEVIKDKEEIKVVDNKVNIVENRRPLPPGPSGFKKFAVRFIVFIIMIVFILVFLFSLYWFFILEDKSKPFSDIIMNILNGNW